MPIRFKIRPEKNLIHFVITGEISARDIEDSRPDWRGHPDYHPNLDILYDLRGATVNVGADETRGLAENFRRNPAARRLAIVGRGAAFGMGRMYQAWADLDSNIQVFQEIEEAEAWLASAPPPNKGTP